MYILFSVFKKIYQFEPDLNFFLLTSLIPSLRSTGLLKSEKALFYGFVFPKP